MSKTVKLADRIAKVISQAQKEMPELTAQDCIGVLETVKLTMFAHQTKEVFREMG